MKKIDEWHAYWIAQTYVWLTKEIGLKQENLRLREHVPSELSHYSSATFDFDYRFPHGFKELHGCANRGQYDLTQHQKVSGKKLAIHDEATGQKVIPRVIEPSQGVDRLFLAILVDAYNDDEERGNIVLKIKPALAPIKVGVFPLVKKDGLYEKAREIFSTLKEDVVCQFDASGSIGRRYARADELGIPFCITVDYESKEDGCVTIRDRDSTEQKRVKIENLSETVQKLINGKTSFINL
jgi:glycyl-tRNA synthetase